MEQASFGSTNVVPLACLLCRSRHVKCDGQQPCGRCTEGGDSCEYMQSKRGMRRNKRPRTSDHFESSLMQWKSGLTHGGAGSHTLTNGGDSPGSNVPSSSTIATLPTLETIDHTPPLLAALEIQRIRLYFSYFHRSHPILLSPKHKPIHSWSKPLRIVTALIGSRFASSSPDMHVEKTKMESSLQEPDLPALEVIQALLLYAIALHFLADSQRATAHLQQALSRALDFGLNHEQQILQFSGGDPLLAETCRRTWWEIYATDATFAALHQRPDFRCQQLQMTAGLPCDEWIFEGGDCGSLPSATFESLGFRDFAAPGICFSSYALCIDAYRTLGRVLDSTLNPDLQQGEDCAQGIDALLSAWTENLPVDKQDTMSSDGVVDELLFRAKMVIYNAAIYIHLPKSSLAYFSMPLGKENQCARRPPQAIPHATAEVHAFKAMSAAKHLSMLASLDSNISRRTPFFICTLVLCAVVYLSACSTQDQSCNDHLKDRISQSIGLLKAMSRVWPLATRVLEQIRTTASEVLVVRHVERHPTASEDSGFHEWPSFEDGFSWVLDERTWLDTNGSL